MSCWWLLTSTFQPDALGSFASGWAVTSCTGIDELRIKETHTDEASFTELLRRYPEPRDAGLPGPDWGRAEKTAAGGVTDHGILRNRGLWV